MTHPFELRGAFFLPDLAAMQKVWGLAPQNDFWPKVFEHQPAPLVLVVWESGVMGTDAFEENVRFLQQVADWSCAGFGFARMGAQQFWMDISGKVIYPRPVHLARIPRQENLLPLDESLVWEYQTEFKGAKDKLKVAYEVFDLDGGPIYCTRPEGGALCPAFFIHWANYHFVETGQWLNVEIEESQMAPDFSTYNRAEPILDLSGQDLTPRLYVNEGERFFQVHTPEWGNAIQTAAGSFERVLKVKVEFYAVEPDGSASREKVFWHLAPGVGLVKMEGDQGQISLVKMPHPVKKKRLFGLI